MSSGKPIAHFERKYDVHSNGQIWNKGSLKWQTQTQNPNGYMKVQLSLNGIKKQILVHQLVALHFLPNPYKYEQVNHIDGDKTNNNLSNLEWISRSGNIQHSLEIGLRKGFMAMAEKLQLIDRVLTGEEVPNLAREIGRHPVVLSKMLRQAAEKSGLGDQWTEVMKERRRNAAIRNLRKIGNRDSHSG